jgi:hypothetical protein
VKEKVPEIQMEVLPPASDQKDEFARLLAYILDDLIPIPGTKYRVGLDPIPYSERFPALATCFPLGSSQTS